MKNNNTPVCRICGNNNLTGSSYPDAHFNDKIFTYYKCFKCLSFSVFPTPNDADFKLMYGENDHTYLKGISGKLKYNFNYPFANHQGYQLQFLNQFKDDLKGKTLLDFACGSGFYMAYAKQFGVETLGVEFDQDFVSILNKKTDNNIITIDELQQSYCGKTFDYIHLGHILEHLSQPQEVINTLKEFAHPNTIFLVDGPLERNFCLHRLYIDFGSKLKAKKMRKAIPQHLSLTTQKSQLDFFKSVGLKKEKYIVTEQYFPLPYKFEKSPAKIISYLIATLSIIISRIIPKSGNLFHYRGKINNS